MNVPVRRALALGAALVMVLGLGACGDDPAPEGVKPRSLPNKPEGDALPEPEALEDGFRWAGVIETATERTIETSASDNGPRPVMRGSAKITFSQTHRTGPNARVEFTARFSDITNQDGPAPQLSGTCVGTMPLDRQGTPRSQDLTVEGKHGPRLRTLIQTMVAPTLFGSRTWFPDRPVRVGEAWEAREFVFLPSLVKVLNLDQNPAVTYSEPVLSGGCRLLELERPEDGPAVLVLELDIVLNSEASIRRGRETATSTWSYRVQGTARMDLATRLLRGAKLTTTLRNQQRSGQMRTDDQWLIDFAATAGPAKAGS